MEVVEHAVCRANAVVVQQVCRPVPPHSSKYLSVSTATYGGAAHARSVFEEGRELRRRRPFAVKDDV